MHRDLEIEIPVGCRPPALFVLVDELSLSELAAAPLAAPLLFPSAHQATKDDGAGRKGVGRRGRPGGAVDASEARLLAPVELDRELGVGGVKWL